MKKDARVSVTFATKSLPSLQRETSLQIEISLITQITYRSGLIKIIKMANITPCSRMCTFRRSFGRSDFTIVNLLLPKLLQNPHIYTGAGSKVGGSVPLAPTHGHHGRNGHHGSHGRRGHHGQHVNHGCHSHLALPTRPLQGAPRSTAVIRRVPETAAF